MSRITLLLVLVAVLMLPVQAAYAIPIEFVATLSGATEVPPSGSPGTGQASVVLDPAANTMHVDVIFSGLLAPTTASHIHCCLSSPEAAANVMVATTTPTFPGFPLGVQAGTYSHDFDLTLASSYNPAFISNPVFNPSGTIAGAEAALVAGIEAEETYLNIHTTQFPGGEIRGFLVPVPEPSTLFLLGSGFAGVVGIAWRRKRKG